MAQFCRPNSDIISINVTGTFADVNESSANDADFIETTGGAAGLTSAIRMGTTDVTDPGVATGHVLRARINVLVEPQSDDTTLDITLHQGGSLIALLNVPSGSFTPGTFQDVSYTLSAGEANSISDYTDLRLGMNVTVGGGADYDNVQLSWIELEVPDVSTPWWTGSEPMSHWKKQSATQPSNYTLRFPVWKGGTYYPKGTIITWSATTDPDDEGWWFSDEAFAGAAIILDDSRPKNPRGFVEVNGFATGSNFPYSSYPGVAAVVNNRLYYTPEGYTVGTTKPTIRTFDGTYDREVCAIPLTSSAAVPKAIMSLLAANGTLYLSTYDSGTNSSDYAGRVFQLNLETGVLTPIGAASTFSGGQLPYALAWHNGRLWCGTSTSDPSTEGKIYYFRPEQDTEWTLEHTLAVGCVSSMQSYKGKLYIGTTAPAATFARVMVRGTDNSYSVSQTASGGTAAANNGFPSMVVFGENLYAGFWNDDTSEVATIYKFDNSSWSTAYSGTGDTVVPYVALATDGEFIYAIGGGTGRSAVLLTSANGTSWNDRTVFLGQSSPESTGLPAFGVISQ